MDHRNRGFREQASVAEELAPHPPPPPKGGRPRLYAVRGTEKIPCATRFTTRGIELPPHVHLSSEKLRSEFASRVFQSRRPRKLHTDDRGGANQRQWRQGREKQPRGQFHDAFFGRQVAHHSQHGTKDGDGHS